MTPALQHLKRQARESARSRGGALTELERQSLGEQTVRNLLHAEVWKKARTILAYIPLPDEVNISLLFEFARDEQKRIALPRFHAEHGHYLAAWVEGLISDLPQGKFRIPEPPSTAPPAPLAGLDLVLVPAVAYDRSGRRLGRGRGFYDRLLAEFPGIKCGVAYDWQLVPDLPSEPHDIEMDFILTPTGFFAARESVDLS